MEPWLITGATGFVGKSLVAMLAEHGLPVRALVLASEAKQPQFDGQSVEVAEGDLSDDASLARALSGAAGVIHLAGVVGYGQTWEACRKVNSEGTWRLVRAAIAAGVRRVVHLSSVSVYGRQSGCRIDEATPRKRIGDPYGDTKIDAEEILEHFRDRGRIDLTMVRPTVLYGPGDIRFLPKLLETIRSGRARILGNGDNQVDLVHVHDLVRLIRCVATDPRTFGETYLLANPDNGNWNEFMAMLNTDFGLPQVRQHVPYQVARNLAWIDETIAGWRGVSPRLTRYAVDVVGKPYFYDSSKVRDKLGFEFQVPLRQGIRQCLAMNS